MKFIGSSVLLCIVFAVAMFYSSVALSNESLKNLNAYFYVNDKTCAPCCFAAIGSLSKEMKERGLQKSFIIGNQLSKSWIKYYRRIQNIDSVIIDNNPLPSFYNQVSDKAKLIIMDSSLKIQYEFSDITNLPLVKGVMFSENKPLEYKLPYDEKAEFVNIFSPFIDYDNKKLLFISPEYTKILCYDYVKGHIDSVWAPTKEDKFYFFDSAKGSKEFWEQTYTYYKQMIHQYFIYSSGGLNKAWISAFSGYKVDSTKMTGTWQITSAIYYFPSNEKKTYIKRIDEDVQLPSYGRIVANLNDSLLVLKCVNNNMHEYYSVFNKFKDEMVNTNLRALTLDRIDTVGSLLTASDNIFCCYNRTSNSLFAYQYNPAIKEFVVKTTKTNFLPLENLIDVQDIFVDGLRDCKLNSVQNEKMLNL
jgi:hypothetical protein